MNTQAIKCFLLAAKYLNFSRAAEELYISQPAVSKNVASLENELGVRLLTRSSKAITSITEEGRLFRECFEKCGGLFQEALKNARELKQNRKKMIVLGIEEGYLLPEEINRCINSFRQSRQDVFFSVTALEIPELMARLENGEIDAAICQESAGTDAGGLESRAVPHTKVHLRLMFSKQNPLADKADITLDDLKNELLFIPDTMPPGLRRARLTALRRESGRDFKPSPVENRESLICYLCSGDGFAFCNSWNRETHMEHFCTLEMKHQEQLVIVWNKNGISSDVKDFISELMKI